MKLTKGARVVILAGNEVDELAGTITEPGRMGSYVLVDMDQPYARGNTVYRSNRFIWEQFQDGRKP